MKMNRKLSSIDGNSQFDDVLAQVGFNGRFQRRFNWLFNFFLVILTSMTYLNIILTLAVPEHWCHVPGREHTNFTQDEWKNLTLPSDSGTRKLESFSKCKMYNISLINDSYPYQNVQQNSEIVDCQHGWDFDYTYYESTVASDQNWVCDRELYVTNAYAVARVGDVVGTFVFGLLSDVLGRRPVYFITLTSIIAGRCMTTFVDKHYPLFLFSMFLGSIPSTAVFQAPLVIAMEISEEQGRSRIALFQCIGWTVGMCILPGIFWIVGDWFSFMLWSTLPCLVLYCFSSSMIESPRWLLSQGKITKCIKELKKIAKVNNKPLPKDSIINLMKISDQKDKIFGTLGLFSNWRLAKNTLLIVLCWISSSMTYYIIVLNVSSLGGNPLLNFFFQGLAELPAYILGQYFSDKFGRRWTQFVAFIVIAITCVPLSHYILDPNMWMVTSSLAVFIKFCTSLIYYACSLLTLEIYPTCVRQSGLSFGAICASAFVILGPYVVYLGTTYDVRYPYLIIALLALVAGVGSSMLPETLHAKLPQTLQDAHVFGASQKFWSLPRKPKNVDKLIKDNRLIDNS